MKLRSVSRRWAARGTVAAVTAVTLAAGMQAVASAGVTHNVTPATPAGSPTDPYAPAYHHPYRHGAVPTRATAAKMRSWQVRNASAIHASAGQASANNLSYGGGIDGIGVTTGAEKVYLVFWGSQWGAQSPNDSNGDTVLANDTSGEAPYAEEFLKGLGTNNELWSGVMTQYCDGVATGAQSCPASNAKHVAYPTGGALAGVWVDNGSAEPDPASGNDLANEAIAAAAHFGNTTAGSNRDAQYVILSATGTNPDKWETQGFCAWHDYNGDSTLSGGAASSPYGDIAFTNLPYQTDAGTSCGQNFVNSGGAGNLDGVSIVEGHEYAETITDQNPAGGWTDSSGEENGDKCAWITPGTSGGSFDLTTSTGTFAVQTTWANDGASGAGSCEASHAIVGNGSGSSQLLKNPGFESGVITPWTSTSGVLKPNGTYPAHSGNWLARLDGRSGTHTDTLSQKVTIAKTWTSATFLFYLQVRSNDPTTNAKAWDTLKVQVLSSSGTVLKTLATYSNKNTRNSYFKHSFSLSSYLGKTIILKFTGKETLTKHNTAFLVDDNALNVS